MVEHIIGGSIVSIGIYALVRFINKDIGTSKLRKEILSEYPKTCENCKYFEERFLQHNGTCKDGTCKEFDDTCKFFKFSTNVYYKAQKQAEFRYNVKGER